MQRFVKVALFGVVASAQIVLLNGCVGTGGTQDTSGGTQQISTLSTTNSKQQSVDLAAWKYVGSPSFSAGAALFPSFAIDAHNTPYMAYVDEIFHKVTVMRFNGVAWESVGNPGFSASFAGDTKLAINSNGIPYVAYQDGSGAVIGAATVMEFN